MTTTNRNAHNSQSFVAVNATDAGWTRHRYLLSFGAYGWTRLLVWANSLDDAFDVACEYLHGHAPGLLADDAVQAEYLAAVAEGYDDERAQELAEVDTTRSSDGHYVHSWEWTLSAKNPTRAFLLQLQGRDVRPGSCVRTASRAFGDECSHLCGCCNGTGYQRDSDSDSEWLCEGCKGTGRLVDDVASHPRDQHCSATSCATPDAVRMRIYSDSACAQVAQ
jgi:hypothetical protein